MFRIILKLYQFLENFSSDPKFKYDWLIARNNYMKLFRFRVEFQKLSFNGSFSPSSIPNQNMHNNGFKNN